jgi:copper homeostasis protein
LIPVRTCLEVCVDSAAGLDIAVGSGADRIELCSALDLAGLTPSAGLMAMAAAKDLPCYVLIRPRAGDFCYDGRELDVMRTDIDSVRSLRLAGVVIGASLSDGSLDEETLRQLLEHAAGLPAVLHRAFDLVPDFQAALETAIRLGFKRVLTSGGAPDAIAGSAVICKLVEQAGDRIEVMAGAGLSPDNVAQFVRATRVPAVHASCRSLARNSDSASASRAVTLGFIPATQRTTDAKVVTAMVESLNACQFAHPDITKADRR